jgi:hypothetical protein
MVLDRRPPEKLYQPWIDDCIAQVKNALVAVDAMIDPKKSYLLFERLTQADVTAVVAERLARVLGSDTDVRGPCWHQTDRATALRDPLLGVKRKTYAPFRSLGALECVSEQHTSDNRATVPKCYSEEFAPTKTGEWQGRIRSTDLKHPDIGPADDIPRLAAGVGHRCKSRISSVNLGEAGAGGVGMGPILGNSENDKAPTMYRPSRNRTP